MSRNPQSISQSISACTECRRGRKLLVFRSFQLTVESDPVGFKGRRSPAAISFRPTTGQRGQCASEGKMPWLFQDRLANWPPSYCRPLAHHCCAPPRPVPLTTASSALATSPELFARDNLNRVATLTLNTSRNLNALSLTMIEATSITDGARR